MFQVLQDLKDYSLTFENGRMKAVSRTRCFFVPVPPTRRSMPRTASFVSSHAMCMTLPALMVTWTTPSTGRGTYQHLHVGVTWLVSPLHHRQGSPARTPRKKVQVVSFFGTTVHFRFRECRCPETSQATTNERTSTLPYPADGESS